MLAHQFYSASSSGGMNSKRGSLWSNFRIIHHWQSVFWRFYGKTRWPPWSSGITPSVGWTWRGGIKYMVSATYGQCCKWLSVLHMVSVANEELLFTARISIIWCVKEQEKRWSSSKLPPFSIMTPFQNAKMWEMEMCWSRWRRDKNFFENSSQQQQPWTTLCAFRIAGIHPSIQIQQVPSAKKLNDD